MEASARLLRLLSLLLGGRDRSGAELAGRLGVDVRTVRRDVEKLRALGYPVHATSGVAGYRLGAGSSVPPLLLDDDDAVAIAIGLRTAASGTVAGIEEASLRTLAKLEQVLPARIRQRVTALHSVTVTLPATGPVVDPATLTSVADACRDHHRMRFDYRAHDGTATVRRAEPHRLVHTGRRWYLIAWDLDRDDWRTYRVDRMAPHTPTGPRFTPRAGPDVDLAAYLSRGITTAAYPLRARILLLVAATEAADRISNTIGVVEAVDAHTSVLHVGANSYDEVAVHMGLLGLPFRVLDPPELVDHIRDLASRLTEAIA